MAVTLNILQTHHLYCRSWANILIYKAFKPIAIHLRQVLYLLTQKTLPIITGLIAGIAYIEGHGQIPLSSMGCMYSLGINSQYDITPTVGFAHHY